MYRDGQPILARILVQVGKTARNTPIFQATIPYITFNPTWTVPTIPKEDVLPKNPGQPGHSVPTESAYWIEKVSCSRTRRPLTGEYRGLLIFGVRRRALFAGQVVIRLPQRLCDLPLKRRSLETGDRRSVAAVN